MHLRRFSSSWSLVPALIVCTFLMLFTARIALAGESFVLMPAPGKVEVDGSNTITIQGTPRRVECSTTSGN